MSFDSEKSEKVERDEKMEKNLERFNLETDFFGDLHCNSRITDMLCDAQAQSRDYSELENFPMWRMWGKEAKRMTIIEHERSRV